MLTATVENLTQAFLSKEILPLLPTHWDKLALNKDKVPLDPNYDIYLQRDARGEALYIALRDKGQLVGYWIAFIAPGLHYKTCLTAMMDIWNLLPGYENGRAALILMRAVQREYERRGVNRSFIGEKLHKPTGRLFKAFGYEPVETYYSKWIGD
jgi:hypothetical protein